MHEGPALGAGEHGFVDGSAVLLFGQNEAGAGPTKSFVRGGSYDVGVFAGIGMQAGGDQSGEVSHVDHQQRAHRIGDLAEHLEVALAAVSAAAGNDHFRLVLVGETGHVLEIDAFVFLAHLVGDDVVSLAGEIELMAMREVSSMREIEAHDGVAWLEHGGVCGLISLGTGMRLYVDVLGVEELFGAIAGEIFDFVGVFAAAVIALAGIAFGVFVGEYAAGSFEDGFGDEVLAGDQLDLAVLPLRFLKNEVIDGGIGFGERTRDGIVHD